ncbi:MAG: hypothetical protein IPP19_09095 [Verrucomicrobia bacterium]|nr:hypothetical protein [Verrucomicrobiota bacterium]
MNKSSPAPSQLWIALPFFIFGFLHLAAALVWLVLEPTLLTGAFYRPAVIAFSHVIGLGFLMSLVAGSSYQLLPVAFENPLFNRTMARIHLGLHFAGVPTMVYGFVQWQMPVVAVGGTAVLIGFGLYIANVTITALRPLRRTPTTVGVLVSLVALGAALSVAIWILSAKLGFVRVHDPLTLLGAHTYLIVIGFFLLFLASVSYTLLPMFLLVPLPSTRRAMGSVQYLAFGIALFIPGQLIAPALLPLAALSACLGLGLYAVENIAAIRRSPRRLDGALRLYAANLGFLLPIMLGLIIRALQLAGHVPTFALNLDTLVFSLAVFGTLSCAILGMGAKIVPFLVWQHRYAPQLGRALVPKLADLVHPRLLNTLAWTVPISALALAFGVTTKADLIVRLGALLFCASVVAFQFNLFRALSHLWRSAAKPFPPIAPRTALKL